MSYNLGQIDPDRRGERYAAERSELRADPRDEEPPARPRPVLAAGAALLVMGLFAGGLWFAYVEGLNHAIGGGNGGDIPLIRADTQPIKVRPANPGGMAIPDRDLLIYGEGRPTVEHLLPPPEQPMARPAAPAPSPPPQAASSQPAPGMAGAVPAEPGPNPARANAATSPATAAPGRPPGLDQAAETAAVPPANAPRAAAKTAPARTGGIRLQLGAVRSEGMARAEWGRISRDNRDLLGSLSAIAVRADLGDKGVYYRIETAPVADMARAERICAKLRQRHLGCIVVR